MIRPSIKGQRLIALFLLGLLLLNYPLLASVREARRDLLGIPPALSCTCLLAWALLIGLMALVLERGTD